MFAGKYQSSRDGTDGMKIGDFEKGIIPRSLFSIYLLVIFYHSSNLLVVCFVVR
jgi:hypothetical protein